VDDSDSGCQCREHTQVVHHKNEMLHKRPEQCRRQPHVPSLGLPGSCELPSSQFKFSRDRMESSKVSPTSPQRTGSSSIQGKRLQLLGREKWVARSVALPPADTSSYHRRRPNRRNAYAAPLLGIFVDPCGVSRAVISYPNQAWWALRDPNLRLGRNHLTPHPLPKRKGASSPRTW
jgi:hypothetical protein